uniref:Uncharacterized protein n=1 Tax=Fagus sylvatica TaxID=28930 RepID=A0A2N9G8Z4_FAGSY
MKPEWTLKIKEEVEKQYNAGFLKVVNYPEWLANVVPVPKKDGKVRYNQIKMAPEDMEKTSFITPWGTYCYKVMPFGLKNAGATYQRAATTLLHDMIHKEVEVYVDDMIVKSKERQGHTTSLRKFFERIRHYKLRLNPKKCMFGVTSGKLLGFIVSQRGIEVDPDKIKAILEMKEPRTEKEIRGFLGRIQYISRFIAQLTTICEPMFKLLKKDVPSVMWKMYFDGASNRHGSGIGILLVSPTDSHIPISIKLQFSTTNNMAEYEACILGLEAAISLGIKVLEVYGDSALIIRQAQKKWKVKEEKLQPYLEKLDMLTEQFDNLEFQYIPRNQNQFADALATLASMIDIPSGVNLKPLMIEQREQPAYCCTLETFTEEENIWYHDIHQYLKGWGAFAVCYKEEKVKQIIEDIHEGAYGPHMNAHMLSRKILRLGYYWTTMEADCAAHVRRCHKCQIHGNLKHMPPMPLYSMSSPWPFATWGIDIIGKIVPKASNGHEFILVAIDYFTKWVEAASFKILNSKKKLLHEYKIKHHKSSPYRPQTNGAVEAANKNVEMILRKNAEKHRNWHERLPYALWGYRTSIRTATGATPYSLVYGMEAVLPIELEIQSLRVVMEEEIPETEWLQERYNQLNMMEEKRLRALYNTQGYQRRAMRAFNKKVKPRNIKIGDMVLKEIRAPVHDPRGKFKPNWSGPFIVKEIYSGGAARLIDIDGNPFTEPTNLDQLKKYFV